MGATGRKLTIRMPDNPRLRSAEVGKVHLDPGARVQSGNPVLTLINRRKEHLVRSPRSGRVVPLIAPGDRVNGGDPLYILHIDEAALEEQNREERAMIAVEREKWTSGVLAEAIEPVLRNKTVAEPSPVPAFVSNWGKPILALALYVLACFALLPILHFFGKTASTPVLIAMAAGCVAFGALIFYLYAPDAGRWPRWTVRMVAISWVGISSLALFYRPDDPNDLTLDNAIGPIAGLFEPEAAPLAPAPEVAPAPVAVVQSGVAVGVLEDRPRPALTEPVTVLASFDQQIVPHNVQVRPWARVNPTNASGKVLTFESADLAVVQPGVAAQVQFASTHARAVQEDTPVLPEGLATAPKRAERREDIIMAAIPQVLDQGPPEGSVVDTHTSDEAILLSLDAFADRTSAGGIQQDADTAEPPIAETLSYAVARTMLTEALPILKGQQSDTGSKALEQIAIAAFDVQFSGSAEHGAVPLQPRQALTPALNLVSALRAGDPDWFESQIVAVGPSLPSFSGVVPDAETRLAASRIATLPVNDAPSAALDLEIVPERRLSGGEITVADSAPPGPELAFDPGVALNLESIAVRPKTEPARVATARSPGLLLISAVRAGEAGWMFDQTQILADATNQQHAEPALVASPQVPVTLVSLDLGQISGAPRVAALNNRIGVSKDFGMAVLPVLDGEPRTPASITDTPAELEIARLDPFSATDAPLTVGSTASPDLAPEAPPLQPELTLVQRDLLYLYFDDPRLLSHPQLGDPWQGLTSPDLTLAIQRTEVVEVHEMLQVQNWCGAANDPDGSKRAELGDDYTTAFINDRIRLLRVRLSVDETALGLLESEIPLFDGSPAGFFHNKAPMLAGLPSDAQMQKGRDYLRSLSAGIFDPNAPDAIGGGQYFDNAVAVSVILQGAGCDQARLNEGNGPANEIGRILETRLGG